MRVLPEYAVVEASFSVVCCCGVNQARSHSDFNSLVRCLRDMSDAICCIPGEPTSG